MKSNWIVYTKKADFKAIGERFGIDQVMARIIRNRGLETDEQINMYLNGTVDDMHSPHLLKDADKCVDILTDKIQAGKKIHIIGDYDIDGICSTTILYKGLKAAGADVTFAVPDRIIDGYGINEHLIDEAYNNGTDTIITCDNGIAAIEQIKYAKEKGMTVIVTDHHDIPFDFVDGEKIHKVPQADAIVNPKQEDCLYPFDKLCGAGVAFKVIKILYEKCGLNPAGLEEYAELMAIATIGDVVDLSDENRVIVKYGLKHLAVTTNIGIRALVEACELEIDKISSYHIGFVIGPCLNATGRLDSARRAIELLLTTDMEDARKKALELRTLNVERKDITGSDKELVRISLDDYRLEGIKEKIDGKDREQFETAAREYPLQFIEYWSVDFDFDGRVFRPEMIFSREKGTLTRVCEKLLPASCPDRSICVKTVDVFGNYTMNVVKQKTSEQQNTENLQ